MSFSQLRYFVAVAEEGHVGRAAKSLRVAQPAVSRQIRLLEHELGVELFHRTTRGMRLSPQGDVLLHHARGILAGVVAAANAVRRGPEAPGPSPDADPSPRASSPGTSAARGSGSGALRRGLGARRAHQG